MSNNEIMSFQEDIHSMEIPITKEFPVSNPPIRGRFIAEPPTIQTGILLGSNKTL